MKNKKVLIIIILIIIFLIPLYLLVNYLIHKDDCCSCCNDGDTCIASCCKCKGAIFK